MKRFLIALFIIIVLVGVGFGIMTLTRYNQVKNLIGSYELVSGNSEFQKMSLGLHEFTFGEEKDLKCNLWNCTGYKKGIDYKLNNNNITYKLDKASSMSFKYDMYEENGSTYLRLMETSNGEVEIMIWKKVN